MIFRSRDVIFQFYINTLHNCSIVVEYLHLMLNYIYIYYKYKIYY